MLKKNSKKYIVFGGGAFFSDLFDLIHANGGKVYKIYQNIPEIKHERVLSFKERIALLGYKVESFDSLDAFSPERGVEYVIGCITVQKYVLIRGLKEKYNLQFRSLVHPEAYLGSGVRIGEGVIVNARAVIAPNVFLDDFCVINRAAMIGHDVRIGKNTRIGPSVSLAGSTRIGDQCSIGMNATILDRVYIGDWAVVGAGSVVTKDIPAGMVAYGVPAKVIRANSDKDFSAYKAKRAF